MRKLLPALLISLLATGVAAEEWSYEDGSVPIAYFDNGAAQLQFACRGGDLTVGFWVRSPHRQVAGAATMNLAIVPDGKKDGGPGSSYAQEMPVIHSDGSSMIVRGPVARNWARIAQGAKSTIRVAYMRTNAKGSFEFFDGNEFGAKGSSAAIKRVLDRCG